MDRRCRTAGIVLGMVVASLGVVCDPGTPGEMERRTALVERESRSDPSAVAGVRPEAPGGSISSAGRVWAVYDRDGRVKAAAGVDLPFPDLGRGDPGQSVRTRLGHLLALDPLSTLRLTRDDTDTHGARHLQFHQYRGELPVRGARLNLHVRGGRVTSLNASLANIRTVEQGVLSPREMADRVRAEGLRVLGTEGQTFLWVGPHGAAEAALEFVAEALDARTGETRPVRALVSKVDGRVLAREDLVRLDTSTWPTCSSENDTDCQVSATGTGDDGQVYALNLYRGQGFPLPYLVDGYLHPYDDDAYPDLYGDAAGDDTFFVDASSEEETGVIYVIHSDGSVFSAYDRQFFDEYDHITYGPGTRFDEPEYGASVSALAAVRMALDYYLEEHGRKGIDDSDSPMDVVVRVDMSGYNAAWITDYAVLCVGTSRATSLAVAVDVIAHELTHGVIDHGPDLEYAGQSGALN